MFENDEHFLKTLKKRRKRRKPNTHKDNLRHLGWRKPGAAWRSVRFAILDF